LLRNGLSSMLIDDFVGIPRDCAEIEIKKAYRRESLKHHPDKVRPDYLNHIPERNVCYRAEMKRNLNW
jgi:preprotein translocase subunit Sec63